MKPLISYLLESEAKQSYDFKIKLANIDVTDEVQDRIEHALKGFEILSVSKPKHLPIVERNLNFPSLPSCDVTMILACLKYPCTDEQIRQALGNQGRLPLASIVVVPANQPEELIRDEEEEEKTNTKKEPVLTKELETVGGAQHQVGMQRVESMLKELESRRQEFAAKSPEPTPKTTNDLPQNNVSPMVGNKGRRKL